MKQVRKMKSVLAVICMLVCGCVTVPAGLAEETAAGHPLSGIPVLREWIEENNRVDEEMAQQGFYALPIMLFVERWSPWRPMRRSARKLCLSTRTAWF